MPTTTKTSRADQVKDQIKHLRVLRDNADAARVDARALTGKIRDATERLSGGDIEGRLRDLPRRITEDLVAEVRKQVEADQPEISQKMAEIRTLVEASREDTDRAIRLALMDTLRNFDIDAKVAEVLGGKSVSEIMQELRDMLEHAEQMVSVDEAAVATYDFRIAELEAELGAGKSVIDKVRGATKRR